MFCPLDYKDALLIGRGLLILIVAIMAGVSITSHQLNSLTERQECIQVFDMSRDNRGLYSLDILGHNYKLTEVIAVAEIADNDSTIHIKVSKYAIDIPKMINIDCRKELVWLNRQAAWLEMFVFEVRQKMFIFSR